MNRPENALLSRRQFTRGVLGAAAAASLLTGRAGAASPDADFSILVLGDTHFDKLAHHDMDWIRREKKGDLGQIENYSRISEEVLPSLLAEVRDQVKSARVPFVIHLGDIVEGLCGTDALARTQSEEATGMFAKDQIGAPVLLTKGNHDVTGPGAPRAFEQVLTPAFRHPGQERTEGACSVVSHGGAWFVFYDSYSPASLEWLERVAADHDPAAGPMVLIIHQPVVPYTGRCWHVFNRPQDAERRARLLQVLAKHRAVVLNGHLHRYGLLRRSVGENGADGWFDQLSLISVIPERDVKVRDDLTGDAAYGPSLTDLEPQFSPSTVDQRRSTLSAERPLVSHFEHANLPGYALLHFRDGTITADMYRGVGQGVWRTRKMNVMA
jgi:3',5'-cyclic AMP phosphodiesterase CpdA